MANDIEGMQKAKNDAKKPSVRLGAAERRVQNKNKALEAAKLAATVAAEAVREAQRKLAKADEKVLECQRQWQEAEEERQRLWQQPVAEASVEDITARGDISVLESLAQSVAGDAEGMRALEVLRKKVSAARGAQLLIQENFPATQVGNSTGSGPAALQGSTGILSTGVPSNPSVVDEGELLFAGKSATNSAYSLRTKPY